MLGTIPREHRAEIGDEAEDAPRVVEDPGLVDPPDHDGVADAQARKRADPTAQPEEAHFLESGAEGGKFGVVLAAETQAVHGVSGLAKTLGDNDGKAAAAGDKTDGCRGRGRVGEDGDGARHGGLLVDANFTLSAPLD